MPDMGLIKYRDHEDEGGRWVRASVEINEIEYHQDHEVYPEAVEYLGLREAKERTRMLARMRLLVHLGRGILR